MAPPQPRLPALAMCSGVPASGRHSGAVTRPPRARSPQGLLKGRVQAWKALCSAGDKRQQRLGSDLSTTKGNRERERERWFGRDPSHSPGSSKMRLPVPRVRPVRLSQKWFPELLCGLPAALPAALQPAHLLLDVAFLCNQRQDGEPEEGHGAEELDTGRDRERRRVACDLTRCPPRTAEPLQPKLAMDSGCSTGPCPWERSPR